MSKHGRLTVNGLNELVAALDRGQGALDRRKVLPILLEALQPMKDRALANWNSVVQSHLLKAGWTPVAMALRIFDVQKAKVPMVALRISHKSAPQGLWMEFGHRIVGHSKKGIGKDTGKNTPGRPWFRPAFEEHKSRAMSSIAKGLQALLAEAFGFGQPGSDL